MHVIAYVYHWDRATLWLLSKSERRMWVEMINEQKKAEAKAMGGNNEGDYGEDDFEDDNVADSESNNDIEDDFPDDNFDD